MMWVLRCSQPCSWGFQCSGILTLCHRVRGFWHWDECVAFTSEGPSWTAWPLKLKALHSSQQHKPLTNSRNHSPTAQTTHQQHSITSQKTANIHWYYCWHMHSCSCATQVMLLVIQWTNPIAGKFSCPLLPSSLFCVEFLSSTSSSTMSGLTSPTTANSVRSNLVFASPLSLEWQSPFCANCKSPFWISFTRPFA